MVWKPHVTVAAVVCRDGKFLLVEEETEVGLAFNQPAGHLEEDEPLVDAVVRETLEETAYHFRPTHVVGVYHWKHPTKEDTTYLRFAFGGELLGFEPERKLDVLLKELKMENQEKFTSTMFVITKSVIKKQEHKL